MAFPLMQSEHLREKMSGWLNFPLSSLKATSYPQRKSCSHLFNYFVEIFQGEAFVTILTPVKKRKKNGEYCVNSCYQQKRTPAWLKMLTLFTLTKRFACMFSLLDESGEVLLTPVRRSTRWTPKKASAIKSTPVVVTTPTIITEDSPGLRLTPDNANQPNEVTAPVVAMDIEETHEDAVFGESSEDVSETGMDPKKEANEMEINPPLILKSACKSAKSESRMLSVTFQSPTENEHQQQTAESTDQEEAIVPVSSNAIETEARRRKKGTPQRFSSRKCRRRVSTPYHHDRPRRRHAVGDSEPSESESQSSADSDSSGAKAEAQGSVSGLRRSLRRTPSKCRDSTPLETERKVNGKVCENCLNSVVRYSAFFVFVYFCFADSLKGLKCEKTNCKEDVLGR